jgi:GNAT superfamily N-acetyltransferase
MAVAFQEENYDDFCKDAMALIIKHWEDIALNHEDVKLDPDWLAYKNLYDAGILHIVTGRTEEGELVGYCLLMVTGNLHYKTVKWAEGDIFYLRPDHRKGMTGIRMMKAAEKIAKVYGASKIYQKVKLHKDVSKVFERMGYTAIERLFMKELV